MRVYIWSATPAQPVACMYWSASDLISTQGHADTWFRSTGVRYLRLPGVPPVEYHARIGPTYMATVLGRPVHHLGVNLPELLGVTPDPQSG